MSRRERAEPRDAKQFVGVRDELQLSLGAVVVTSLGDVKGVRVDTTYTGGCAGWHCEL